MENFPKWFKVMYFYSIAIISAYSFIKLSIGFFLLRLADRTRWRPFLIGMLGKYANSFRKYCDYIIPCGPMVSGTCSVYQETGAIIEGFKATTVPSSTRPVFQKRDVPWTDCVR